MQETNDFISECDRNLDYMEKIFLIESEKQTMKEIKVIAVKNLPANLISFVLRCAVIWLFLDKFEVSVINQIWIGAILMILFTMLIIIKFKETQIDIFKKNGDNNEN